MYDTVIQSSLANKTLHITAWCATAKSFIGLEFPTPSVE